MAAIGELSDGEKDFLKSYLPPPSSPGRTTLYQGDEAPLSNGELSGRPFVTLTYACSLDSMISLAPGIRTALSGPETKSMTHYLRLHHDAIMVGVGTATADDPSLNCRYLGATLEKQPRPIILDPNKRFNLQNAQLTKLARENRGKQPWVIRNDSSSEGHPVLEEEAEPNDADVLFSSKAVKRSEKLEWSHVLRALKTKGIDSVMVEGGATIINDLLSQPDLVDSVIITIAPTWLGQGGTSVAPTARNDEHGQKVNAAHLEIPTWKQFGQDVVLCGQLKR